MRYFFRVPAGTTPVVSSYYVPKGQVSVSPYSGNVWAADWSDDAGMLLPGAKQDLGDFSIHLSTWGTLPETDLSLSYKPGRLAANQRILLLDKMGHFVWGALPNVSPDTIQPPPQEPILPPGSVKVVAWDEGAQEANHPKPRLVIQNTGTQTIQHLVVRYFFQANATKTAVLESDWYLPKCKASLISGPNQSVQLDCRDLALAPGASYPDATGLIFGLHWSDWSAWSRALDWSGQYLNAIHNPNAHIVVQDGNANLIWGQTP